MDAKKASDTVIGKRPLLSALFLKMSAKNIFFGSDARAKMLNGVNKLADAVKKFRDKKEVSDKKSDDVLKNIAEMLFSPKFQELLKH